MSTSTCIAVDSACDLPRSFIDQYGIRILPISLRFGDQHFLDTRDPRRTVQLYASKLFEKDFSAESEPASTEVVSELMRNELALQYDEVLAITISSTRSDVYKNIREAVFVGTEKLNDLRREHGKSAPFKVKVLDSETLFSGQGLLTYEAVRLLRSGKLSLREIIERLEGIKGGIRAFLVPQSLYHLKNRARAKGDNSVGWLSYGIGSMLDIKPIIEARDGSTFPIEKVRGYNEGLRYLFERTEQAIEDGLVIKAINMSYAGKLSDIESLPEFRDFAGAANARGITTMLSVMSSTAAINVGPGAFSLSYCEPAND
ncbi:DegV family protein [Gilvimarinus sp. F26214L]|uniref:DegV family protein n=1 Tax=Gilvimarinus sp. DZF01 TaxID=3461371 RepID=UPI0040464CB0